VHPREQLLVSFDHGDDDGTPECVEFLVIHLESALHLAERRVPLVIWQQGEVIAKLADRERLVQPLVPHISG
jgi:hypothetical protein